MFHLIYPNQDESKTPRHYRHASPIKTLETNKSKQVLVF